MLNKVILSGYLGKFVNTGVSQNNGTFYAHFQLSQYTGDPNNKYQYVPLSAWDNDKVKPATRISQAHPGDYVIIEGHIKVNTKTAEDNRKYKELSLVIDSVRDVITPTAKEYQPQTAQNQPPQPQYTAPQNNYQQYYPSQPSPEVERAAKYGLDISSDDLPF